MKKSLLFIILLLIVLATTLTLVFRTTIFVNRATNYNDNTLILKNSYIFASPLQANTKNNELIRLTVFILDNQGMGVANQLVTINSTPSLTVQSIQATTNELGQATFNLSASTPGKYTISAQLGNSQIPQTITLTYY